MTNSHIITSYLEILLCIDLRGSPFVFGLSSAVLFSSKNTGNFMLSNGECMRERERHLT